MLLVVCRRCAVWYTYLVARAIKCVVTQKVLIPKVHLDHVLSGSSEWQFVFVVTNFNIISLLLLSVRGDGILGALLVKVSVTDDLPATVSPLLFITMEDPLPVLSPDFQISNLDI